MEACGHGGDKTRCDPVAEVRDDVDEVLREPEVGYCPDHLVVVNGGESPLGVYVA